MMKNLKAILIIPVVLSVGGLNWYFFIDTLNLSQVIGKTDNPYASIFVNFIDFDTGLTRYDIYNLSKRNAYWQKRVREVTAIRDPEKRNTENAILLAEMMEDQSIRKIIKKVIGFGNEAVFLVMQAMMK